MITTKFYATYMTMAGQAMQVHEIYYDTDEPTLLTKRLIDHIKQTVQKNHGAHKVALLAVSPVVAEIEGTTSIN